MARIATYTSDNLLRKNDLAARLKVTPRTITRWCAVDPTFPQPIRLGVGPRPTPRWRLEEVEDWLRRQQVAVG